MLISVESGVPLPPPFRQPATRRYGSRPVYPWKAMKVGDSFFVAAAPESVNRIQTQLAALARRRWEAVGSLYTTRIVDGGVRVWRTK